MRKIIFPILLILFNFIVAYIISLFSIYVAIGWFCFAIGFQFGKWGGKKEKEEEIMIKEVMENK